MKERKTAQIVTRVTEDDRAWVDREADKQGLDPSSFIRMTLRRARNATSPVPCDERHATDELLAG
jgi:uncharacterized protein (DUF1778 family)